ncbi:hypothetical protein TSAR_013736 [Trichomalopsis sarcophagae]|uniref:Uncharacterized protein n=1 Tax=Trichomalopsis sarcophagae TaxID=543379 RepID=A0A232EJL5_9HYME|nr:hypothetical protein TSAR_013736 [Trichomalopsis sarcophagae]
MRSGPRGKLLTSFLVERDGSSIKSQRVVLWRVRLRNSESADGDDWHTVRRKRRGRGLRVKLFDESRKREEFPALLSSDNESRERFSSLCASERKEESTVVVGGKRPGYSLLSKRTMARTAARATSSTVSNVADADVLCGNLGFSADISEDSGYVSRVSVARIKRDVRVREFE